ncbi:hypothetical protein [Desulfosporosinus nitroreducens]|uniref:hypothetical protein n=1 Tax=Desulfosporosinus nitroreducens TaxID=2018668 RepID=UPI00207C8E3E|nr:hypothetical protein [Desulfosporosinus nitroreducens]MCO1604095.1 hypothetical protein [Desulfosporosinus nitroreducens]
MAGVATISFCGVLLLILIILKKVRARFGEVDEKFGKPYFSKIVKIIGGHPDLKRGSMAISLHPKDAIAFNRKVFLFSQISSIKIISQLPIKLNNGRKTAVAEVDEQYLCIEVKDEHGEHEVVFTTKSDFIEVANKLIQKWNKYNLLN